MKHKLILAALLLLCEAVWAADAPAFKPRTWTAKSGATVEATLVRHDSFTVTLKGMDGKLSRISPSALSEDDQAYLAQVKEFRKYADKEYSTKILECQKLTFECSPDGHLFVSAFGYHSSAGGGRIMECFLDPQVFIDTLDKGLEWCRIAREKNAEAEDRELYDSVRLQVQCLDGMKMTFQSENKRTGLRSSITPQVSVDLYEEVFPYSRSASVTLAENDLKTIAAALKKVPFTLIQEHAATEKKKEDKLFK